MARKKYDSIEDEIVYLHKVTSGEILDRQNRMESPSSIEFLEEFIDPQIDSIRRLDVQRFIFDLSFNEVATILFLSMGYKRKEIHGLIGYKRVHNVNQIVSKVRKMYWDEQF